MFTIPVWMLAALICLPHVVISQQLVAALDYGTFQGAYSKTYNISYWQKIPFAAPPIGENRFRAPQPVEPISNGVYNSSQPFDMCPQRTVSDTTAALIHIPSKSTLVR
jgi:carboxylesterase type B